MKLLIDECLSPRLAMLAQEKGHGEAGHVVRRGLGGKKDWELRDVIEREDWLFVTKNSVDFRGPADAPGSSGQHSRLAVHAGLICLNGPPGMDLSMQLELFEHALDELARDGDMVNQVLEITMSDDGIEILRYTLPAGSSP